MHFSNFNKVKKDIILRDIMRMCIVIFSIIITIIVYIKSQTYAGYNIYFLVPLTFAFLILIFNSISNAIFKRLGLTVMFVVMNMRYILLPLILCLGKYNVRIGVTPEPKYIKLAIISTLLEMVTIFITSHILINKFTSNQRIKRELKFKTKQRFIQPINYKFIYILLILLAITIIVIIPEVIADYRFIFNTENISTTIKVDFPMAGLFKTILSFAQYAIVLIIINFSYKKYMRNGKIIYIVYSLIAVLLSMTITSNLSRFTILIPTITYTYLLTKIFPKEAKKIMYIILGSLLCAIVFMTAIKFFGEGRGSSSDASDIMWWADTLQMYLAGPRNIAIAISGNNLVNDIYGPLHIKLLFTDLFSNVAMLSNFVPTELNSVHIFNYAYYNSSISVDQIPPFIASAYYYFGYLLAPIWASITIAILFWLDEKAIKSRYLDESFIFNLVSVYFGLSGILGCSMVYSMIFNSLILFLIVIKLNKLIVFKKLN